MRKRILQRSGTLLVITGGIASGKSFILKYMKRLGFPVFQTDTAASKVISAKILEVFKYDKAALHNAIIKDPSLLEIIENVVHPVVQEMRDKWIYDKVHRHKKTAVLEIPLFFEKTFSSSQDRYVNAIVISAICGLEIQKKRAHRRQNSVSEEMLNLITTKQYGDDIRKKNSDIVIYTHGNKLYVKNQIKKLISYGYKSIKRNCVRY